MSADHETGALLLVDDDDNLRSMLSIVLERDGHDVRTAAGGEEALQRLDERPVDLVVQDIKMPGMNGLELLERIKGKQNDALVVVMTAFSTWDTAVEAMRLGAYSYIRKPFENQELRALVQRALAQKRLHEGAPGVTKAGGSSPVLIGSTDQMQANFELIRRVAPTDSTVIIQGESGTGKELVARLVHMHSLRSQNPLITVNCGAFTESLLESELFGHVRGAFTGAVTDKKGLLEVADGGTFFLDELGEMPLQTQVRFLRLLENREFIPVGGTQAKQVDVRLLCATNRDLEALVEEGQFREDLFYRLNVIRIDVPPLRERRQDIPLLAGHFLAQYAQRQGKHVTGFSPEAMEYMAGQDWPGNVRELENTVQRAVTLTTEPIVTQETIASNRPRGPAASRSEAPGTGEGEVALGEGFDLEKALEQVERRYVQRALDEADGNMTRAADLLGISFRQIRYKIKKLGLRS
jgi:two-component system response regulator PilR (NtrC family)